MNRRLTARRACGALHPADGLRKSLAASESRSLPIILGSVRSVPGQRDAAPYGGRGSASGQRMRSDFLVRAPWLDAERVTAYAGIFLFLYTAAAVLWIALSPGLID